jgi:hypothetical protein
MQRFVRRVLITLLAVAVGSPSFLHAQSDLGKLQGRVTDPAGQPIAQAQVLVTGTAFGAVTDQHGFYFINNIPAGTLDARIRMIGFGPVELQGIRIIAGQTVTQDVTLTPQPVQLEEITVIAAYNVLVPRDEVTTKQRVDGEFTEQLPVDRLSQMLALQPGVVGVGNLLSVRGGRPDENVVYVDGVPTTPATRQLISDGFLGGGGSRDRTSIEVPLPGVEQASVTTGAAAAEFGGAQSGLISVATRSGGRRFSGMLQYETDEPFGAGHGLGLNRIGAGLGGPLFGGVTFYLAGTLTGQKSQEQGKGSEDYPLFVAAGVDTTVAVPDSPGVGASDTTYVDVLRFAIGRGECDKFAHSSNPQIRNNYGLDCQGIRLPYNSEGSYQAQGKLQKSYGSGSYVSGSYLRSQRQRLIQPYFLFYNSEGITGYRDLEQAAILGWNQNLSRRADRALAIQAYLSYQTSDLTTAPLGASGALDVRDTPGGFLVKPLPFLFDDFKVDEQLVENFQRQQGRRAPLQEIDPGYKYEWRVNPYGASSTWFSSGGGPAGSMTLSSEKRWIGRGTLDWQVDRFNRVRAGGEYHSLSLSEYFHNLAFDGGGDVWQARPHKGAVYAEDRIDLGDLVFVGGLRYDWYNADGHRPMWYDTTSGTRRYFPRINTNPDYVDTLGVGRLLQSFQTHTYLSPRVQVAFPVTDRLNMRFSYSHQVQPPDFWYMLRRENTDWSLASGGVYGTDLDFSKTILFEFGNRYAFSQDMVLDLSVFNRDDLSRPTGRTRQLYDPKTKADVTLEEMTGADYGNVRGIDLRLDRRIGTWLNGFLGYTFQAATNTGSDPLSYLDRSSQLIGSLTGQSVVPPQAAVTTRDSRPHNLTGAFSLQVPTGWKEGTFAGSVLSQVGAFVTFQFASGTAYTACPNTLSNQAVLSSDGGCAYNTSFGAVNGARLPAMKQLDLRLTKGFRLGPTDVTAYFEARNLFNFTNTTQVFSATGSTRSRKDLEDWWVVDSLDWYSNADRMGVLTPGDGMDLTFGASGCGPWLNNSDRPAAPDCIYLIGAEQRWGNGDGIFDVAEQRRASTSWYYAVRGGTHLFTGPPRRLRLGLEVNF